MAYFPSIPTEQFLALENLKTVKTTRKSEFCKKNLGHTFENTFKNPTSYLVKAGF